MTRWIDWTVGREKYVILVTTGVDTFSKLTLDKITKKIKDTKDVTVFPISIGWALREYCETARLHRHVAWHGDPNFANGLSASR